MHNQSFIESETCLRDSTKQSQALSPRLRAAAFRCVLEKISWKGDRHIDFRACVPPFRERKGATVERAIASPAPTDYIRKRENLNHRTDFVSSIYCGGRKHECSHI